MLSKEKNLKKIAIVSSISGVGGIEVSLMNFLKTLPKEMFDVTLLLTKTEGPIVSEIPAWIKVKKISILNYKEIFKKSLKNFDVYKVIMVIMNFINEKIKRFLSKDNSMCFEYYEKDLVRFDEFNENYDLAVTWSLPNSHQTVYTLEKVKADKKFIWIHMDIKNDIQPVDAEKYFYQYDKIFCVSKACKDSFDEIMPTCITKTVVFYNVINTNEIIRKSKEKVDLILDDRFKIVTCGRISSEKQPFLAINIAKELIKSGITEFVWYFIGNGVEFENFKQEIEKNNLSNYIILLGQQNNPFKFLKKANLYVQMSRHESFCMTLAEAQILGIPSISTNFNSAYEIIDNGVSGYVVPNDPEKIFTKIKLLIENSDEYLKLLTGISQYKFKSNGNINDFIRYVNE